MRKFMCYFSCKEGSSFICSKGSLSIISKPSLRNVLLIRSYLTIGTICQGDVQEQNFSSCVDTVCICVCVRVFTHDF